jgi:hypothetical protein
MRRSMDEMERTKATAGQNYFVTALHADTRSTEDTSRSIWKTLRHLTAKMTRHFAVSIQLEIKAGAHIKEQK